MQIDVFESVVIDKKIHIERLKIYNTWDKKVFDATNNLMADIKKDFELKKFFDLLSQRIEESDSDHVKAFIFDYYQRFYARHSNWERNRIVSQSVLARGIKVKTAGLFFVFLFLSVMYVLFNEAMRGSDRKDG